MPRLSWLLAPHAVLPLMARADQATEVTVTKTTDVVEFKVGSELVTRYHFGATVAKPYFYPLNAPGNVPVTRAWPLEKGAPKQTTDHVHQKSVWFCHGDVVAEGLEAKAKAKNIEGYNFWDENPGYSKEVCVGVGEPTRGTIVTRNEWRTPEGTKILDETRTITLEALGTGRLLVIESALRAADYPLVFADTKEGAMGVRVSVEIAVKNGGGGKLVNAEGKEGEKACWGHVSKWCDYFGTVGGKPAGVALFDHPSNVHPASWHIRDYGLMAANPFGRQKSGFPSQKEGAKPLVRLAKGEKLTLRYGVYAHAGNTTDGKVAEVYARFAK